MPTFQERLEYSLKFLRRPSAMISFVIGFGMAIVLALVLVAVRFIFLGFDPLGTSQNLDTVEDDKSLAYISELPDSPSPELTEMLPVIYQVSSGDSSWEIAQAFYGCGLDYVHIEQSNSLRRDELLEVGQELVIPAINISRCDPGYAVETPQQNTTDQTDQSDQTISTNDEVTIETEIFDTEMASEYVVQPGDSLWKISQATTGSGYDWVKLYDSNKAVVGSNPDLIYPGQTFTLSHLIE